MLSFREYSNFRENDEALEQEISQINVKQLLNPQWTPDEQQLDEYERGEAERVVNEYGKLTNPPTDLNMLWQKIMLATKNPANLKIVYPQQISGIDNFNSSNSNSLKETIEYLESKPRDWRNILNAFQTGSQLPAPVVIVLPNGVNHLMSGNSRLMMARALNKPAKILYVTMQ